MLVKASIAAAALLSLSVCCRGDSDESAVLLPAAVALDSSPVHTVRHYSNPHSVISNVSERCARVSVVRGQVTQV